jgi:hypothetical protein
MLNDYPGLNVTSSYLGKEGMTISFDGVVTTPIETMTGVVQSPEPYQRTSTLIHLLKPQALANAWKEQIELNSLIGDGTLRTDAKPFGVFTLSNCSITQISPVKIDGTSAEYAITLSGIYFINSSLWNM